MESDFLDKYPLNIETVVIKADPASLLGNRDWRVWRFYPDQSWRQQLLNYCHYSLWCMRYTLIHFHRPLVIKEYICGYLATPYRGHDPASVGAAPLDSADPDSAGP